ncbi:MAG: cyclopropane-fatty-acyl-phospholipid synthase family protein [Novosphingobium sp.]|nr:cyclopropane-fatty-acyl-phospholipid synthase family protein [Novosphingobium sp.]
MNAQVPSRGKELVEGGRSIGFGPEWLARAWSGGLQRIVDRIDKGIARGSILVNLPDGTTRLLGGKEPGFSASVTLRSPRALLRLATAGSIGWYQAWDAQEWESPDPVSLFALVMDNANELGGMTRAHGPWRWLARVVHALHRNSRAGALRNIHAHYDLGNDFYAQWLDETMSYSCARFDGSKRDLKAAQQHKIATIAERLAGARSVLEIGCGWGSLAAALAESGMEVTAISLSDEQLDWARQAQRGKPISFRKQDYRDVTGEFDAIASVEMIEAVGREFWPDFVDCLARCLKPGGRAAIQFIAMREDLFEDYARAPDFIQTYIFPGGMLIKESEFRALAHSRGLRWQDRESFGADYAQTLRCWRDNFDRAVDEGRLPADFDERFVRLWRFYLMYCEGGFRGGGIDVAQVTLVKPN